MGKTEKQKAKRRAYIREWRRQHPESMAKDKAKRKADPVKVEMDRQRRLERYREDASVRQRNREAVERWRDKDRDEYNARQRDYHRQWKDQGWRRRVYNRQQGKCFYCGDALHGVYEVDHKTPISRGGSSSKRNKVVACIRCGRQKQNRTVKEWLAILAQRR